MIKIVENHGFLFHMLINYSTFATEFETRA